MAVDSLITGSRVVTPSGILERNIAIDNGRISEITTAEPACDHRIRGDGLLSIPGMIDTHVHYGVYSQIGDAARTESHAAAIGGVTTMMRMLRLQGLYRQKLGAQLDASAGNHFVDYTIHASIFTKEQMDEMEYCREAGIGSFKLYMNLGGDVGDVYMDQDCGRNSLQPARVNVDDEIVEGVIRRAASLGAPVCVHAEDSESCGCGMREAKKEGLDGLAAWSESRSTESEAKAISRVSGFARKYGCTIYFVHIGSAAALDRIRKEKALGTRIFVETCPHYLSLSHDTQKGYLAKVMPPIRADADVARVWESVASGEINTLGTDHVANRLSIKLGGENVWGALAGFPGIGVALPLLFDRGVNAGRISVERLVDLCSTFAARVFSMYPKKGVLLPGSDADIAMIDAGLCKRVSPELFGGYSDYSVYDKWEITGWPVRTLVRGKIISEDFALVGRAGHGEFVAR